jgi:tRNA A22 N-methylase
VAGILTSAGNGSVSWKLATILNKWTKEDMHAIIQLLQAQNLEPMNNHRQVVTICGVGAISVQQGQKWCL